jgi:hypothetical protein
MGPGQTLMIYKGHYERHRRRIAELEAALRKIRDALAPGTIRADADAALLDDPFEWIDSVARKALGE